MTTWTFIGTTIGGYGAQIKRLPVDPNLPADDWRQPRPLESETESADAATADAAIAIIAQRRGAIGIEFEHEIATGFYWVLTYDWDSSVGQAWRVIDSFPSSLQASPIDP
jgi:hypothetical protein